MAAEDYDVEGLGDFHRRATVVPFNESDVTRRFGAAIDEWSAGDLTFRVISTVRSIPDPRLSDL